MGGGLHVGNLKKENDRSQENKDTCPDCSQCPGTSQFEGWRGLALLRPCKIFCDRLRTSVVCLKTRTLYCGNSCILAAFFGVSMTYFLKAGGMGRALRPYPCFPCEASNATSDCGCCGCQQRWGLLVVSKEKNDENRMDIPVIVVSGSPFSCRRRSSDQEPQKCSVFKKTVHTYRTCGTMTTKLFLTNCMVPLVHQKNIGES